MKNIIKFPIGAGAPSSPISHMSPQRRPDVEITISGPAGSGKSSLVALIAEAVEASNLDFILAFHPSSELDRPFPTPEQISRFDPDGLERRPLLIFREVLRKTSQDRRRQPARNNWALEWFPEIIRAADSEAFFAEPFTIKSLLDEAIRNDIVRSLVIKAVGNSLGEVNVSLLSKFLSSVSGRICDGAMLAEFDLGRFGANYRLVRERDLFYCDEEVSEVRSLLSPAAKLAAVEHDEKHGREPPPMYLRRGNIVSIMTEWGDRPRGGPRLAKYLAHDDREAVFVVQNPLTLNLEKLAIYRERIFFQPPLDEKAWT